MRTDAYRQVNPLSCVGMPGWVSLVPFFQWCTYQITRNMILIVDPVAFLLSPLPYYMRFLSLSTHPPTTCLPLPQVFDVFPHSYGPPPIPPSGV